jgi:hypothetical protein
LSLIPQVIYSVAGQSLFHSAWYVFPIVGMACWMLLTSPRIYIRLPFVILSSLYLLLAFGFHSSVVPQSLTSPRTANAHGDGTESQAIRWLRENTPPDAVILTDRYYNVPSRTFTISGLARRRAYLEYAGSVMDQQALRVFPNDNRQRIIETLWRTTDTREFCVLLTATSVTHVLVFAESPVQVRDLGCVTSVWTNT